MTIGHFETDRYSMPVFHYEDNLPYRRSLPNGEPVRLPEDPWFLLGNYQLTLFAHVSGEYELICGQRSWGRLNQAVGRINSGDNAATITVQREGRTQKYALTGMDSIAADSTDTQRFFGCGYAIYSYKLSEGVRLEHIMAVRPSHDIEIGRAHV